MNDKTSPLSVDKVIWQGIRQSVSAAPKISSGARGYVAVLIASMPVSVVATA